MDQVPSMDQKNLADDDDAVCPVISSVNQITGLQKLCALPTESLKNRSVSHSKSNSGLGPLGDSLRCHGDKADLPDQYRTIKYSDGLHNVDRPVNLDLFDVFSAPESDRQIVGSSKENPQICDALPSLMTYVAISNSRAIPTLNDLLFGPRPAILEDRKHITGTGDPLLRTESLLMTQTGSLGIWEGVVSRNLMQIFSGMMFLRLGVTFGQAGIALGTLIISSCAMITITTALSLSAIATNGAPHPGGAYYMISRSLGPKFGGAIGTLMVLSHAADTSIFIVAFSEALLMHLHSYYPGLTLSSSGWDVQIIGYVTLVVLIVVITVGVEMVSKAYTSFLLLMVLCLASIYLGAFLTPPKVDVGFVGASSKLFWNNFGPDLTSGTSVMSITILFFPAMTGFTAATTVYAELKNPERSYPLGMLISIIISSSVYIISGWILGSSCVRQVDGKEGLIFRNTIMVDASLWSPLVYFGIYASTLTSALGSLVSGPRILLAICRDQLFPFMNRFLNSLPYVGTSGKQVKAPINAVANTNASPNPTINQCIFLFCFAPILGILLGSVNSAARLSSGSNLLLFMLINYAVFATALSASPGWRPTFKYINKWVSLFGFFQCAFTMVFVNPYASLTSILLGLALYKYIAKVTKKTKSNWGSAGDAVAFAAVIRSLENLKHASQSSKAYRPNILVLCGSPGEYVELIRVASLIRTGRGLMTFAYIVVEPALGNDQVDNLKLLSNFSSFRENLQDYLNSLHVKGFATSVASRTLTEGVRSLIMTSGLTPHLITNVVCLGFKNNWNVCPSSSNVSLDEYVYILRTIFSLNSGIAIIRNPENFHIDRIESRFIDVWWLFDDGGLTILIAYLLTKSPKLRRQHITLRVMTVVTSRSGREAAKMVGLVRKLRIPAEVIPLEVSLDIRGDFQPSELMRERFATLSEYLPLDKLTLKILHLSDLVRASSSASLFSVVTVPVPNISYSSVRYMAWLDCLSCSKATTFLLRGNQTNVLSTEL
uniref:Amino acid permease/ SLC12A domain-containing protein n=1 Tax=Spongospora subterranea TaxID=70186 RepID=A0A0H5QL68_9EUKA|eukprot:CRZ02101.1 hypothetical protein [Spongospora subterranea]